MISRSTLDGEKVRNPSIKKAFYQIINISFKNSRKIYKYYYKKINYNIIKI